MEIPKIVSVDDHVMEPGDVWTTRLPAKFQDVGPRLVRQKIAEMKLQSMQRADQSLMAELQQLKDQMAELRDTTTKYDLSFDTALQRLESRMGGVEQRVQRIEQQAGADLSSRS